MILCVSKGSLWWGTGIRAPGGSRDSRDEDVGVTQVLMAHVVRSQNILQRELAQSWLTRGAGGVLHIYI